MPGQRHCRSAWLSMSAWQRHCRSEWLAAALPQCLDGNDAWLAAALPPCLDYHILRSNFSSSPTVIQSYASQVVTSPIDLVTDAASSTGLRLDALMDAASGSMVIEELSVATSKLWRSGSMRKDVAPKNYKVRWEYAEKGRWGKPGWFEMHADLAEQLEGVFADRDPTWLRIPRDDVIWKFDLVGMTQRRIKNGNDECTRRIRRIFVRDDFADMDADMCADMDAVMK